jgi:hypothetical protein
VLVGLTDTVIVGPVPLKAIPPGASVPLIVPLPVTARLKLALCPLQIVVVPLNTAVGLGFTVTVAVPLRSAPVPLQLASVKVAIE